MKQTEMQSLVDSLARQRKHHMETIANTTMKDLKDMRKPNYVPRLRTKDELKGEVHYKKSWVGGSADNDYFQQPAYIKPVVLDEWTMKRVQMPERAYKKFFFQALQLRRKPHKGVWHLLRGYAR
ncbi:hypothetical protein FGO68_gene13651 [Halteria grandinella]|uniref:Uncharacterized protein n=1 Tax=Halteria grandinella TaxID=5974 RepID=A0A8J8SU97_HALGN|nr:hypothetical protein FGO68_gene13651 [Halteria grandinella]